MATHVTRQRLRVAADDAWAILVCRGGARQWFDDQSHPGVVVGASVPVRGAPAATIRGVEPGQYRIELADAGGRRVDLVIAAVGEKQSEMRVVDPADAGVADADWQPLLLTARFVVDRASAARRPRQAVVVIHGVGNQRPLATVKRFTDALVDHTDRWSKPDRVSRSYELRRYQLERTRSRPRTDIYELYWADRVPGTQVRQVTAWLRRIVIRRPRDLSPKLRPVGHLIRAAVLLLVVALGGLVAAIGMDGVRHLYSGVSGLAKIGWISLGLSLIASVVSGFVINVLGGAARYLDAAPDNIAVRQSVREAGISLLRRLHDERGYDRIVLVGHSLGSVIAYDIICQYWIEVHRKHGRPVHPDQSVLKAYRAALGPVADRRAFQRTQRDLWDEFRRFGNPWLVTDLITAGSPLTYATTLLAGSPADLENRISDRELPTCPPNCPKSMMFDENYLSEAGHETIRVLTHDAPFAVTRWTNLYAPAHALVFGDPIGGQVAPVLGTGINDVAVKFDGWFRAHTPMAHTSYWARTAKHPNTDARRKLAAAIDLESANWLNPHVDGLPWPDRVDAAFKRG